jgi:ribonuclease HII
MKNTADRAAELARLQGLTHFEKAARQKGYRFIAGVDEAGRGPLAGPVVAAACSLPEGLLIEGVNDSKKLTPEVRAKLFKRITEDSNITYGVGIIDAQIIDQINILRATFEAMLAAVASLPQTPDYLLVDGHMLPAFKMPAEAIVKGDALSLSIAAASIIAKETRDQLMLQFHALWPAYGFDEHKGYGTAKHLLALKEHGPCPIHRLTFEPVKSLISA